MKYLERGKDIEMELRRVFEHRLRVFLAFAAPADDPVNSEDAK